MDDGSPSSRQDLKAALKPKIDAAAPKRRKVVGKNVVTVRIEAGVGKQKGEGPPSDLWSWRKYGQKPIKGSPYPRGYYKCSTSKGCSAKKQVERCKIDSSVLIITYTSDHNHPGPSLLSTKAITTISSPKRQSIEEEEGHHQSPLKCPEEPTQQHPITKEVERSNHGHLNIKSSSSSTPSSSSQSSSHEEINDFFDELEELHMPSSFTSLMRSNFFDERLLQTTLVDVAGGWSLIP